MAGAAPHSAWNPFCSVSLIQTEAEGMTGWIEQDAHVVARLELGEPGAQGDSVLHRNLKVVDLNVEVPHRALSTWSGRPDRRHIVFSALKDHVDGLLRRLDHGGIRLLMNNWPVEQRRIKRRESHRVRRFEGCAPP
jgi:hypothetical protein